MVRVGRPRGSAALAGGGPRPSPVRRSTPRRPRPPPRPSKMGSTTPSSSTGLGLPLAPTGPGPAPPSEPPATRPGPFPLPVAGPPGPDADADGLPSPSASAASAASTTAPSSQTPPHRRSLRSEGPGTRASPHLTPLEGQPLQRAGGLSAPAACHLPACHASRLAQPRRAWALRPSGLSPPPPGPPQPPPAPRPSRPSRQPPPHPANQQPQCTTCLRTWKPSTPGEGAPVGGLWARSTPSETVRTKGLPIPATAPGHLPTWRSSSPTTQQSTCLQTWAMSVPREGAPIGGLWARLTPSRTVRCIGLPSQAKAPVHHLIRW